MSRVRVPSLTPGAGPAKGNGNGERSSRRLDDLLPAPLSVSVVSISTARLSAATLAGRIVGAASRLARQGTGASIRGKVLLKLDPSALHKLLIGKRIAVVSGTNGKTTTTHFLAAALRQSLGADAGRLVHNADGANLHHGLASALSEHPEADIAILESDERVVGDLIRLSRPEVLVLLNFSRDQLDRHHEIKSLGRSWRTALAEAGPRGPIVVANADEPLVVWAALAAQQVIWVDTAATWTQDSSLCPECDANLVRIQPDQASGQGGDWYCSGCDLARPKGDYRVEGGTIVDPTQQVWDPQLSVPGIFNISNAACALAAAELMGVAPRSALTGMRTVTSPAGRFATARFGNTTARLILAKNPAGWAEALPLAQTETVVLAIDSAAADGRDVSWLWDVDYERLAGRTVIATGRRAQDLAVRLRYAEVDYRCIPDLATALANHSEPIDVIATYTPFQQLRRMGRV
jgi:UDP-N-acetylmuramyl tripeptide synthase